MNDNVEWNSTTSRNNNDRDEENFQSDIEKAIALSLETARLDEIRRKNVKQLYEAQLAAVEKNKNYSSYPLLDHSAGLNSCTPAEHQLNCSKSRPRPDKLNLCESRLSSALIAPPPCITKTLKQRTTTNGNGETDLIQFTSLTQKPQDDIKKKQIDEIMKTAYNALSPSSIANSPGIKANSLNVSYPFSSAPLFSPTSNASTISCQVSPYMPFTPSLLLSPQLHNRLDASPFPGNSLSLTLPNTNNILGPSKSSSKAVPPMLSQVSPKRKISKVHVKCNEENLIDLSFGDMSIRSFDLHSSRKSVLDFFDPLASNETPCDEADCHNEENIISGSGPIHLNQSSNNQDNSGSGPVHLNQPSSNQDDIVQTSNYNDDSISEKSFYEVGDPFEYMYSHVLKSNGSDRLYDTLSASNTTSKEASPTEDASAPPIPPRQQETEKSVSKGKKRARKQVKNIIIEKIHVRPKSGDECDSELVEFVEMVKNLAKEFKCQDEIGNSGLVISPTIELLMDESISVKLVVHHDYSSQPILFTCNVDISVEHIISHVLCQLEGSEASGELSANVLQVWGLCEYLSHNSMLQDYEYVHKCIKYDEDVHLKLVHNSQLSRNFARQEPDDNYVLNLTVDDIYQIRWSLVTYNDISILLETLQKELLKVKQTVDTSETVGVSRQGRSVIQTVKAICLLLGGLETPDLTSAIDVFLTACSGETEVTADKLTPGTPYFVADRGDFTLVAIRRDEADRMLLSEQLSLAISHLLDCLYEVISMYCRSQHVDFVLESPYSVSTDIHSLNDFTEPSSVKIVSVHSLDPAWSHDSYGVTASLYHGTKFLASCSTQHLRIMEKNSFFERIIFNEWMDFQSVLLCTLPRETRIVLSLVGLCKDQNNVYQDNQLGWASIQLFSHNGILVQGMYVLPLWPDSIDKRVGPAPHPTIWHHEHCPSLVVQFPDLGGMVCFPEMFSKSPLQKRDLSSLDDNTQQLLIDIVERDTFTRSPPEDREVLWEKRHYLHELPQALPKVLLAAHSWDWASLTDLHGMVRSWCRLDPIDALQLLLPCFPDREVRSEAISWIKSLGSDELVDYLPQLVQALKYETYDESGIARFLLERSLTSPALSHHLYWLLCVNLDNSNDASVPMKTEKPSKRRIQLMFGALIALCGSSLRMQFKSQDELIQNLDGIAMHLKSIRDAGRPTIIQREVASLDERLAEAKLSIGLPLNLSYQVRGLVPKMCSYFTSNTLPLKLTFRSSEWPQHLIHSLYKIGDDLRQDMLTLQMIRIMDKLWLKEGIDLKIVTFGCVATGNRRGMIEMVQEAETLRKIQTECGVTGSFKDRPLNEWLAKNNPAALDFEKAVRNFTLSCAGYCVATYVLGICDRHNDNIMVKTSGHLFHIDFGKFLGDSQMFGNFKRDRTPFVLTPDMAYVINGGDKPSERFHIFVDLCCQAFNILRKHGNLLLNLFALMISSEIPGVTLEAVNYIQGALLPELSNAEAAATFTRMIEESLKSWFTQVNFFLHNLAQLRFTGDPAGGSLLSFIPKVYSESVDGRIKCVKVYGYQKRYDPEKYYVYILSVARDTQPDPSYLFRSYREFCEFHQKLCVLFPLAKYHSLPKGRYVGRSNIKQVAEKRKVEIEQFLSSLFKSADEIAHSEIVYTFFHPLLRDQEEANIHLRKYKERSPYYRRPSIGRIRGSLRISLLYERGALQVLVEHARDLATPGGQQPSAYVKVYLLPDPMKITKRKTKVVKKCTHPTFMEMLEYRMPLEVIEMKLMQATIWNYDPVQENEFLGSVNIPLSTLELTKKHTEWYSLEALSKR